MKEEQPEQSDNELIAEFMEYPYRDVLDTRLWKRSGYHGEHETLRFNESWDWLMPVVERIKGIKGSHFILRMSSAEFYMFGKPIVAIGDGAAIESTFKAVVEFIKWYNQQNHGKET